jgi:hypothetical protein
MIDNFTDLLDTFILSISFVCHLIIFTGISYTVFHKNLPLWQRTSLWYIGISSCFVAFTIILQWMFGPKFPLSYDNIGILGEVLLNMSMAFCAYLMFQRAYDEDHEVQPKLKLVKRPSSTTKQPAKKRVRRAA